jgi:DHA2 family multidrug resistance protein
VRRAPIDGVGLALLVLWVGSLQIMLDKGKDLDWFASTTIVALALIAVVSFAFFVIWELTAEHPVVDLSLFRIRNFTGGTIALAVGYGLYFGNLVLLPLWLQTQIGYTATDAGLVMAPVGLFAILLSPLTGKFLPRTDPRYIATAAFLTFALCFWMRSLHDRRRRVVADAADARAGHRDGRLLHPAGVDHAVRPARPPHSRGIGPVELRADHVRRHRHVDLPDRVGSPQQLPPRATGRADQRVQPDVQSGRHADGQAGLTPDQAHGLINNMATQQAAQLGVNDLFYISAAIFVLLIGLIWITKPERAGGGDAGAAASAAH